MALKFRETPNPENTPNPMVLIKLCDETGSLVILVFSLFLLLLIALFAVINVSNNFLAKRQLVEIGEVAVTRAAHQISFARYYSGDILMDTSGVDGTAFRIPIDCSSAYNSFRDEITSNSLRGSAISITAWNCAGDEVSGTIAVEISELLKLPFGIGPSSTSVTSTVGATSIIGGVRG